MTQEPIVLSQDWPLQNSGLTAASLVSNKTGYFCINFTSDSAGSWIRKKTKQNKNLAAFYLVLLDLTEKVNDHSETNVVIHDLLSISLFV